MPYIAIDFHLSPLQSGVVLGAFYAGYSVFQIPGGLLADVFGVRVVATISILWRAMFAALTGAAANITQLLIVRVLFGLGDGLFPGSAFKTIAIWFPKRERTTANALMLALSELGTALAPLAMIPIVTLWGWRTAFYSLLLPGGVTALLFWTFVASKPSESRRVTPEELAEIEESSQVQIHSKVTKARLFNILKRRDVLMYFLVVFAYDTAYWGYWSWLPTYLVKARGFSMTQMGAAASLPSFAAVIGCAVGGWVSDRYFSNRRTLPIILAQLISALLLYLTFTADSSTKMVIYQTIGGFGSATSFALFRVGGSIRFCLHPRLMAKPSCSLTGRRPGRDARFMLPPPASLG